MNIMFSNGIGRSSFGVNLFTALLSLMSSIPLLILNKYCVFVV